MNEDTSEEYEHPKPKEVMVPASQMMRELQEVRDHYEAAVVEAQKEAMGAGVLGGLLVAVVFLFTGYGVRSLYLRWSAAGSSATSLASRTTRIASPLPH